MSSLRHQNSPPTQPICVLRIPIVADARQLFEISLYCPCKTLLDKSEFYNRAGTALFSPCPGHHRRPLVSGLQKQRYEINSPIDLTSNGVLSSSYVTLETSVLFFQTVFQSVARVGGGVGGPEPAKD
mmetsp:Transcript_4245/g.6445  ORF Transcript_4245/g.6445 Transcript_4245/m.6445 type:complete len:127 (-) Transcript_4245:141-521(-)